MKNYRLLAVAFAFLIVGQTGAVEQRKPANLFLSARPVTDQDFASAAKVISKIGVSKDIYVALLAYRTLSTDEKTAIAKIAHIPSFEATEGDEKLEIWKSVTSFVSIINSQIKDMEEYERKNILKLKENQEKQTNPFITPEERGVLKYEEEQLNKDINDNKKEIMGYTTNPSELNDSKGDNLINPSVIDQAIQGKAQVKNIEESKDRGAQSSNLEPSASLKLVSKPETAGTGVVQQDAITQAVNGLKKVSIRNDSKGGDLINPSVIDQAIQGKAQVKNIEESKDRGAQGSNLEPSASLKLVSKPETAGTSVVQQDAITQAVNGLKKAVTTVADENDLDRLISDLDFILIKDTSKEDKITATRFIQALKNKKDKIENDSSKKNADKKNEINKISVKIEDTMYDYKI